MRALKSYFTSHLHLHRFLLFQSLTERLPNNKLQFKHRIKRTFTTMEEINSGNPHLDEQLKNWLEWDQKGSESFLAVQKMIADKKWDYLDKIMSKVRKVFYRYDQI